MKKALRRLFRRKFSETSTPLQEDLRKLGLVLTGAGILAMFLDGRVAGSVVIVIGMVNWMFGLTERRNGDVDDS